MTLKKSLVAGAAGLALSGLIAIPAAFAGSDRDRDMDFRRHGQLPRVHAEGAAPSQYQARMEAVHRWRDKVADRYGFEFSHWWTAKAKDVTCERVADDDPSWDDWGKRGAKTFKKPQYEPVTRCHVSAIPARRWGFGWNFN